MIKKICDFCGYMEVDVMSSDKFNDREDTFNFTHETGQIKRGQILMCHQCLANFEEAKEKVIQDFVDNYFTPAVKERAISKYDKFKATWHDYDYDY